MTAKRDGYTFVDTVAVMIDPNPYDDRPLGRYGIRGFEADEHVTALVRQDNERRRMKARDTAVKIIKAVALSDGKRTASCPGCVSIPFANCVICNGHGVINAEASENDPQ